MKPLTLECSTNEAALYILRGLADNVVVIGPICWRPSDGRAGRMHYFIVASGERGEYRCDQLICDEQGKDRAELILAFADCRPPLVIIDTDDELEMAKMCERIWPGTRATKLRKNVEAERRAEGET